MDTRLEMIDKLWNRHVPDVPNVYIVDKHMHNYLLIFFVPGALRHGRANRSF